MTVNVQLMWSPEVGSVEKAVVSSSSFDGNRIDTYDGNRYLLGLSVLKRRHI